MAKRKEHLSQAQVKIRILAYLYNKGSQGANSYTIQQKANIPSSQESNRFKGFLEELCTLSQLEKYEVETGGKSIRIYYRITNKGRQTIDVIRNPLLVGILDDKIDDLF